METYVVISGKEDSQNILYAGTEQNKADKFNVGEKHTYLRKQIWVQGILFKEYDRTDIYNWNLIYDKVQQLEDVIQEKREDLEKDEQELLHLKEIVKNQ